MKLVDVRRLSWVGTRTDRFSETRDFFGEVLGLPLVTESPGFAMFQLPGGYLEVFAAGGEQDEPVMTTGPVPGFLVDDIAQARSELEAAGLEMLEPIRWMTDVDPELVEARPAFTNYAWFQFRGPDGHVYCCNQGTPADED